MKDVRFPPGSIVGIRNSYSQGKGRVLQTAKWSDGRIECFVIFQEKMDHHMFTGKYMWVPETYCEKWEYVLMDALIKEILDEN